MLSKTIEFVKKNQKEIILIIGVVLISLLSFSIGYISRDRQIKTQIKFQDIQNEE